MHPHHRITTAQRRLERVLDRPELGTLAPEERAETLSLLLVEMQRRIGLELQAFLDETSERQFRLLMEREADPDEVVAFLSVRIPDYQERVERAVDAFCDECRDSLDALSVSVL